MDASTGTALPGIAVLLAPKSPSSAAAVLGKTDQVGEATLLAPAGPYTLIANPTTNASPEFGSVVAEVTLRSGDQKQTRLQLMPLQSSLRVRVTDSRRQPVSGVLVNLDYRGYSEATGEEGECCFRLLPRGTRRVSLVASAATNGHFVESPCFEDVCLEPGEEAVVEFALQALGAATFRFSHAVSSSPPIGLTASLRSDRTNRRAAAAVPDTRVPVELKELAPGPYDVILDFPASCPWGAAEARIEMVVEPSRTTTVWIELDSRPNLIEGTVLSSVGEPVRGIRVCMVPLVQRGKSLSSVKTGANGGFSIHAPDRIEDYALFVDPRSVPELELGYAGSDSSFLTLLERGRSAFDITMPPGARVIGTVRDMPAATRPRTYVHIEGADYCFRKRIEVTEQDPTFEFRNLRHGTVSLYVVRGDQKGQPVSVEVGVEPAAPVSLGL